MALGPSRTNGGHGAGNGTSRWDHREHLKVAADRHRRIEDRAEAAEGYADALDEVIAEHSPELLEDWVDA